ncbi:dTMP kinase, partial [Motilibacter deserti]
MSTGAVTGLAGDVREVLSLRTFRRMWVALSVASLGDWLGLLAMTAYAQSLAGGDYTQANLAVAVVFLLRLAPAMLLGPLAGVVADRLDRRWTMVTANAARFVILASIPLVGELWWVFVATLLNEAASLFFIPAKEATVPNLVPRERLEAANQLNLAGTYGSAPLAAVLFIVLTLPTGGLGKAQDAPLTLAIALWVNALTFLAAAIVIAQLKDIPARNVITTADGREPSAWKALTEGWKYVGGTKVVRGLIVALLGAFAAGGAVIGLARTYVRDLGAGDPGYGVLFFAVFLGLALGMFLGPRLVAGFSRRRLLCLAITVAGFLLAVIALTPNLPVAVLFTVAMGACTGVAWVIAYTLIGLEVDDDHRGRVFASLTVMLRVVLVAVLALAPLLAAAIGPHTWHPTESVTWTLGGAEVTLLLAGLLCAGLGVASFRTMDDRRGVPVLKDFFAALRGQGLPGPGEEAERHGFFLVLEGGEGAGKSTQATALAAWLRERGHEVVLTREPGGTEIGTRLRALLLDPTTGPLSSRAEALLYAADRAQHVERVVRPALARSAVVISDRYVDSSIAYQGAGRELPDGDVARLSAWATGGLVPDLTVLLDLPAEVGAQRRAARDEGRADRLEAEPVEFHDRVRRRFKELASAAPGRYLVLDASQGPTEVTTVIQQRLRGVLPLSPREAAEQEAARQAEEQRQAEERRRLEAERHEAAERKRAEEAEARRLEQLRAAEAIEAAQRATAEQAARAAEAARREAEEARRIAAEQARLRAEEAAARAAQEAERREREAAARAEREEQERRER